MPIDDLLNQGSTTVVSLEDRIAQTSTMVRRTFGTPAEDIGEVVERDNKIYLDFTYEGQPHSLTWKRQSNGAIFWYLDDSPKAILLSDPDSALSTLRTHLSTG